MATLNLNAEQDARLLGLTQDQLDGIMRLVALCRGDRQPLESFVDIILGVRAEADQA